MDTHFDSAMQRPLYSNVHTISTEGCTGLSLIHSRMICVTESNETEQEVRRAREGLIDSAQILASGGPFKDRIVL